MGKLCRATDLAAMEKLSWWYNWGLDVNDVFQNVSFINEFVPMLWGPKKLADLDGWKPHPSATRLLSFNEPNMALQSNITGAEACAYWPTVKKAAATHGLRLGSPAVNHCTGAGNRKKGCFQDTFSWLDDFFNQPGCGAETVDFITTHMYGCNGTATLEFVQSIYNRYKKPVWLTEFNCGATAGAEEHLKFMEEALPAFDSAPAMEGYAWFMARSNQASTSIQKYATLLEDEGDGKLTAIGKRYLS